jgi:hypothetical protein
LLNRLNLRNHPAVNADHFLCLNTERFKNSIRVRVAGIHDMQFAFITVNVCFDHCLVPSFESVYDSYLCEHGKRVKPCNAKTATLAHGGLIVAGFGGGLGD